MSERSTVDAILAVEKWRIVNTISATKGGETVTSTYAHHERGVIHISISNENISGATIGNSEYRNGTTIAAGDRLRWVLAKLQGER